MATKYTFVSEDDRSSEDATDRQEVNFHFETDFLDAIAEKVLWFVRAAGFNYVDGVTFHKNGGDDTTFRI